MNTERALSGEAKITIAKDIEGNAQISLKMDEETYQQEIKNVAEKRGITIGNLVGEALRLERLFIESRANGESFWLAKRNIIGEVNLQELIKP